MKSQTVSFATQTKNGTVARIGKSTVLQPKTNFKGDKGTSGIFVKCWT